MPRVKIAQRCIIAATPSVNITYDPADDVVAPDAHIDEIVARGCGERLTSRGDFVAGSPPSAPAQPEEEPDAIAAAPTAERE